MVMGGIDLRRARTTARLLPRYVRDYYTFRRRTAQAGDGAVRLGTPFPITADRTSAAGETSSHYFLQDLWAARKIYEASPERHIDIGSRIDGFVSHLLVFRSVEVIDIRPLEDTIDGLAFRQEDAMLLDTIPDRSVESLSSLHAVEHFGLGRYGDPLDPQACFKAMRSFARVLAPGGRLYFSVPIGRERVEFNAHRILDPVRIVEMFATLDLIDFAAISNGRLHDEASPADFRNVDEATGLYEFRRPT